MIRSIIATLSQNILSEEKEVVEAALANCRILGANNHGSKAALEVLASKYTDGGRIDTLADDKVFVGEMQSAPSTITGEPSPREMISVLLILDGMMKGSLSNEDATAILHEIDSNLDIPSPDWFRSSPSSVVAISTILCHSTVIDNVSTNSSLAWALLDATQACVEQISHGVVPKMDLTENVIINMLIGITYLLGCPGEYGLSSGAMSVLGAFSSQGSGSEENAPSLLDVHFRSILSRITSSAPSFPWKQSDPAFLAMDALLRSCSGCTVGCNFNMVAPFFISHLSISAYKKNTSDSDGSNNQSLKDAATKDEIAEEYSLRISLMALLQTVLSDESFSHTLDPRPGEFSSAAFMYSSQFTTDAVLSIVLPNLVWRAGGMASALRKLAAATLYCLLSHCQKKEHTQHQQNGAPLHPETIAHLVPVLHSNLEDTESTTRELTCVCLSLVLEEQVSTETFSKIWETNARVIDTLYPRLLELLDDCHDPVRMAACIALEKFLALAHAAAAKSSFDLGLSSLENTTASLLIQLDDPDQEIQACVFQLLSALIELQSQEFTRECRAKNKDVVEMIDRQIRMSLNSHQDGSYCRLLLQKVEEYHVWESKERAGA
mmetsp:Transcript_27324/g.65668  ORF Transcript_27324/g.65668 Transcript_27324/m.65668 type:complete len:607 (+) Transcript_27324:502-2322(+)